jgi:hypothetical protein
MRWSVLVTMASLLTLSCGSSSGDGPPKGGTGGSAGSSSLNDAAYEEYPPEPGVCRPLCCSNADCAAGAVCTPFDTGAGTLGVCSTSWAGDGGSDPDAGTGGGFPESCWSLNKPECNPLTNEACAPGGACDVGGQGDPETQPIVSCFYDDNTQGPDEVCDNVEGPFCVPGYHCVPN